MRRLLFIGLLLGSCVYLDSVVQPSSVTQGESFKITITGTHDFSGRSNSGWLAIMLPSGIVVDSIRYWTSDSISSLVTAPDSVVCARAREAYPCDSGMCWWGFSSELLSMLSETTWVAEVFARVTDSALSGAYLVDYRTGSSYSGNLNADSILDQPMTVGPVGVVENPSNRAAGGSAATSTIIRGYLLLPPASSVMHRASSVLLDITGREVMDLRSGANDIRHLSPGVYFVRQKENKQTRKVVIMR